ncbi:MAG: Type II secretion system protein D [Stenotrophomonas maltophilia]|nr:MAG: Type II secretion system protein D [Stenotrophomonas maltophilia]
MTYRSTCWCLTLALLLQGCAAPTPTAPGQDSIIQDGLAGTGPERKPLAPEGAPSSLPITATASATEHQILSGSRRFVSISPEAHPAPRAPGENGVVFNFTNQSIQAVANIILGDLLKENYSIAPSVTGEVTFSTSKPVDKGEALAILQTLLSWTNNALIRQGDRYLVLPANQAVAGQLVPRMSVGEPGSGLTARLFVLDYLSAPEMQKLLRPFARDNAFLLVDSSRNVLVLAGTQEELDNYQRTIDTFDVNWLKGMSIGVFNLKRARATELTPELNRLFGPDSGTPLAGMLRFLPIERTNAVIAISTQATYLTDVSRWIDTIDQGGGNEPQMYVYDARNLKATDLAGYLRQMYSREAVADDAAAQVAPGLRTLTLTSNGGVTAGSATTSITGQGALGSATLPTGTGGAATSAPGVEASQAYALDNGVRITAEKTSNQLLVRCRPSEWAEIQSAIQRLDVPPMQVQIETRILEVSLTGSLNLGVQWYLGHLAGNSSTEGVENLKGSQGALGAGGAALGSSDALFYSFVSNNLQVALHALETSGNTRVLSAPSLVVMNNQQAQIQVGDNIPISQTTINL